MTRRCFLAITHTPPPLITVRSFLIMKPCFSIEVQAIAINIQQVMQLTKLIYYVACIKQVPTQIMERET